MASETGATKDRIERAAKQWAADAAVDWESINVDSQADWCATMEMFSGHLVRPDERIVLADDLEHLLNAWDRHVECCRDGYQCEVWMEERAAAYRLRAAIGTPTVDPVCPQCQERTYESPRTGRTCVRNECGWREREL